MTRTIYVIKTEEGYLTADGSATADPFEAISFVDLDVAGEKVRQAALQLTKDLTICPVQVQFPKPIK
jgi:hypothetical protein